MNAMHPGLSEDEYRSTCEPALSQSTAHVLVTKSPAHAWHFHRHDRRRPTDEMVLGSVIDALILGGDCDRRVAVISGVDSFRKKEARALRDQAIAEGKIPVTQATVDKAASTADRIRDAIARVGIDFGACERQMSIFWEEDGVQCRGRADAISRDWTTVFDLKTTSNLQPNGIGAHMVRYGYDIQAAAYVRALETLRPELAGRVKYVGVFVETEEPHGVLLVELGGTMCELGTQRWQRALRIWRRHLESGEWPSYPAEPMRVEAPAWAMTAEFEAELNGASNAPF